MHPYLLSRPYLRTALAVALLVMTLGVSLGLVLVADTTGGSPSGTIAHFQGDSPTPEDPIPMAYPMPLKELLITTHNHIITFTFIFGVLLLILELSGAARDPRIQRWMWEPFVSIAVTFGSMWGIRYLHASFFYLMLLSSTLLYLSYYIIVGLILRALLKKNPA